MQNIITLSTYDSLNSQSRLDFLGEVDRILDEDLRDAMQDISQAHCRCICPEARRRGAVTMPIENRTSAKITGYEATVKWVRDAFKQCSSKKIQVSICVDQAVWQFDWDNNQGMIRRGQREFDQAGRFDEAQAMNQLSHLTTTKSLHSRIC